MATIFFRSRSHSYYVRLSVPADLRTILCRSERQKSLGTSSYREAKIRSALWGGRIAALFVYLRGNGQRMRPEELRPRIQQYISDRLNEWEQSWNGIGDDGEIPACDTMETAVDDNGKPSESQWQDHLAVFMESNIDDFAKALKDGKPQALSIIEPVVQEFLSQHTLRVERTSPLYRFLCRELLRQSR